VISRRFIMARNLLSATVAPALKARDRWKVMASRKNGMAYATKDDLKNTATELRTELKDEIRSVGVMVERLESKVVAFAESADSKYEGMRRDMQAMEERLGERITALESVVRGHSGDVRSLQTDVRSLQKEVADLRRRFDQRDHLEQIEQRVTVLEKRISNP